MSQAAEYKIDPANSVIHFSGTHAGSNFKGTFEKWDAAIWFDPNALDKSNVVVTIDTASIKTGNKMYDGTLPSEDWFNVKTYPTATFKSTSITSSGGNEGGEKFYTATGDLTIRDVTKPVSFTFTLSPPDVSTPQVKSTATFTLDRLAYDLGKKSDEKAEWVSKDIMLEFELIATRQ